MGLLSVPLFFSALPDDLGDEPIGVGTGTGIEVSAGRAPVPRWLTPKCASGSRSTASMMNCTGSTPSGRATVHIHQARPHRLGTLPTYPLCRDRLR